MNKFAQKANQETSISPIIEGKERFKMTDIIAKYPDGITVTGFDVVTMANKNTGENEPVPVLVFDEDHNAFFFGGKVLYNIVNSWCEMYDGDIETTSTELAKEGGVKMHFERGTTKKGNQITKVKVLG